MVNQYRTYSRYSMIAVSILFIIALFIRVQFVSLNLDHLYSQRDAKQYINYAHNIVQHRVFSKTTSISNLQPDSYRSPGYPLFIALIMIMLQME